MEKKQSKIIKDKTSSAGSKSAASAKPAKSLALPKDQRIITAEGLKRKASKEK